MSVVAVEERGPVSVIAVNRPEKLSAGNKTVAIERLQAFARFDAPGQDTKAEVAAFAKGGGRAIGDGRCGN